MKLSKKKTPKKRSPIDQQNEKDDLNKLWRLHLTRVFIRNFGILCYH